MLRVIVGALYAVQELFRFLVVCKRIPGVKNVISDQLSRAVIPSLSLPHQGRGWNECAIPNSVRQLPGPGPSSSPLAHESAAILEAQLLMLESSISSDSVVHDMKLPSLSASLLPIPWIPYKDIVVVPTLV